MNKNREKETVQGRDMAGKVNGQGANMAKLENQISCIKYSLFCFNIIAWVCLYFPYFMHITTH